MIYIENIPLPKKALSNIQLLAAIKKLKIPNFKGIYMRDEIAHFTGEAGRAGSLPTPNTNESGILNLDDTTNLKDVYGSFTGEGTHWVAWYKVGRQINYFDSYGLPPPLEFEKYIRTKKFRYNSTQVQPEGSVVCGHLCLYFLVEMAKGFTMKQIVDQLDG